MDFYNEEYLKFNSLYISADGRYGGIGTYSSSWGFICGGSVSAGLTTSTGGGVSASFVYNPYVISMAASTTYFPGTSSICYINKSNTSNLLLSIATPSNDGIYVILRRIDTNTGTVTIQPTSTETKILERGFSSSNATASVRLNGNSSPVSLKLVYLQKCWYEL